MCDQETLLSVSSASVNDDECDSENPNQSLFDCPGCLFRYTVLIWTLSHHSIKSVFTNNRYIGKQVFLIYRSIHRSNVPTTDSNRDSFDS